MGVPFTERFFDLTVRSEDSRNVSSGWIGMIVSNAFMKRTFGKKLVEDYLSNLDLTHVIDTSGVYCLGMERPQRFCLDETSGRLVQWYARCAASRAR